MKISSIHALQSSTTSHKLLESVRSLRPLLCEALRASGCDTIDINEQEPVLHGEGLQNEDVQCLNYLTNAGQHHDIYAQCLHFKELANLQSILSYGGHIHDHDGHVHVDLQVQHCNPAPESHNYANDGDAVDPSDDVQHHGYGHYHDTYHHGYGKYGNAEYGQYGNVYQHYGDALHHGYGHHGDAHHHGHGFNSNSIIVSTDNLPRIMDDCSELPELQEYQEQIVQMNFSHFFPMTRESSVNVDPHTPLSCSQYPQADNHLLDHQYIHAYHNLHWQETMAFMNTVLLEAPARYEGGISNEALIEAEASNKINNNNEGVRAQDSSKNSVNNVEVHEACAGHQANCRELRPLLKSCKQTKRPPRIMSKQLESSGESKGTDNEEGGKLLSPKGKVTISTANLFSERRRRKKWNEALYALRVLVPIVSKMDKLSIVGDTLTYLHQLKDIVDNLQNDICSLQTEKEHLAPSQEGLSTCTSQEMETGKESAKHKILELDVHVVDMEQKTYHLCIRCEIEDLVLLELTKAIEALNLNMLNANIAVTNESQILYTVVVKVNTIDVLTPDMLKESILKSATMYGFHL